MAEQEQQAMLSAMTDVSSTASRRAAATRTFVRAYPDFRPLPIGLDVIDALLEDVGFEAALVAAIRLEGAAERQALARVLDVWPADFPGNASVTAALVKVERFDQAERSIIDEFGTYFAMERPLDRVLLSAWGRHLVRSLNRMGWDAYLRVQKEAFRISMGKPALGHNLLRDAFVLAQVAGEELAFRDRVLKAYTMTYTILRSDLLAERDKKKVGDVQHAQVERGEADVRVEVKQVEITVALQTPDERVELQRLTCFPNGLVTAQYAADSDVRTYQMGLSSQQASQLFEGLTTAGISAFSQKKKSQASVVELRILALDPPSLTVRVEVCDAGAVLGELEASRDVFSEQLLGLIERCDSYHRAKTVDGSFLWVLDPQRIEQVRAQKTSSQLEIPEWVPVLAPIPKVRTLKEAEYCLRMESGLEVLGTKLDAQKLTVLMYRSPKSSTPMMGPMGLVGVLFEVEDLTYSGLGLGGGESRVLDARDLTQMAAWAVERDDLTKQEYTLARAALIEAMERIPKGEEYMPIGAFRDASLGEKALKRSPDRYRKHAMADLAVTLLDLSLSGMSVPTQQAVSSHIEAHRTHQAAMGALPLELQQEIDSENASVVHSEQNPIALRTAKEALFVIATDGFDVEAKYQNGATLSVVASKRTTSDSTVMPRIHFCFELSDPKWVGSGLGPGDTARLSDRRLMLLFGERVNLWEQPAEDLQVALDGLLELQERAELKGYHRGLSRESLASMISLMEKRVHFAENDPAWRSCRVAQESVYLRVGYRLWRFDKGPRGELGFEYNAETGWMEPCAADVSERVLTEKDECERLTEDEFSRALTLMRREFNGMAPCSF